MAITLPPQGVQTISAGAITVTVSGTYPVANEGGASTDDLGTINGGTEGQVIALFADVPANTTRVRHNAPGNIRLSSASFPLTANAIMYLILRNATWLVLMPAYIP